VREGNSPLSSTVEFLPHLYRCPALPLLGHAKHVLVLIKDQQFFDGPKIGTGTAHHCYCLETWQAKLEAIAVIPIR
jgi:hypothetical protein